MDTNEPYLTWLQYILTQPKIPQVISTSYGDDEQTVPYSFAISVCNGFAQLGARGISVIFASGDNGVGPGKDCFTNDGKNTTTFLPSFPASCVCCPLPERDIKADYNLPAVRHHRGSYQERQP
jgi:tripeptidyl-peptidase-1